MKRGNEILRCLIEVEGGFETQKFFWVISHVMSIDFYVGFIQKLR